MIAPSGARSSLTKRQIAIKSLRAQGDDRDAPGSTLKRANTVPEPCRKAALWLVPKAKARRVGRAFCGLGLMRR
jgi:hypothetical protein